MKRRVVICGTMVMLTAGLLTGCGKKTIDLNSYYSYEITGLDGYGSVEESFDSASLEKDLLKAAKLKEDSDKGFLFLMMAESSFTDEWDQKTDLKNGDTIVHSWDIAADELEEYHISLIGKEEKVKVKGLESAKTFDAFENLTITYEGVSPNGTARLDTGNCFGNLNYSVDKGTGLSNGDVVTVKVAMPGDVLGYYQNYGGIPETDSCEFTVSGLDEVITRADQIPQDVQAEMSENRRANLEETLFYGDGIILEDFESEDLYVVTPEDNSADSRVYLVSKVTVSDPMVDSQSYYTYSIFRNPVLKADGSVELDYTFVQSPAYTYFFQELEGEAFIFPGDNQPFGGYLDKEELVEKAIYEQNPGCTVDHGL